MTQTERLVEYLRHHPGASSLDIIQACQIVNTTGRISDARQAGHRIDAVRDDRGVWRFYLKEPEPVGAWVQTSWTE